MSALPTKDEALKIASHSNQMLNQDADKMILGAEFRLLKTMVHFTSARLAMKAALANRSDNGPTLIEWSTLEREWLFHSLTESPGHDPLPQELQDGGTVLQLQDYLKTRTDVPDGAFVVEKMEDEKPLSNPDGDTWFDSEVVDDYVKGQKYTEESKSIEEGCLDLFFTETDDVMNFTLAKHSISHEERAELTVQEAVATLLKATAQQRLSRIKNEWKVASEILANRKQSQNNTISSENEIEREFQAPHLSIYDNLDDEELKNQCTNLGQNILDAMNTVRDLTESSKQLSGRLLDYCSADGMEGRLSKSKQDELARMLAEHLASLPDDRDKPGFAEDYIFGADDFNDDIDTRYGGSPSQIEEHSSPKSLAMESSGGDDALFESIFE